MVVSSTGVRQAGRYRLEDPIAAGGTGEVWRAADALLGRAVAVKLLRPEYANEEEALARFRAEAQHAALVTHPGVVQVYDYGQAEPSGVPYLVMELVDGPSLAEALVDGPLDPAAVLDVIAQVATALAAAHAAGMVHRDIKPANLLLAADRTVKITDFGIALASGSASLTQSGTLPGTPGYLAPERAAGAQASAASDLYSLGVVAWECLAGAPPFSGTPLEIAFAHAQDALPPLPSGVPAGLAALVADLTAKDPAARPASATAVAARARRLRAAMRGGATTWPAHPSAEPPAQRPVTLTLAGVTVNDQPSRHLANRLWRWAPVAAAGAAAVAAVVGGMAFALSGTVPQQGGAGTQSASGAPAGTPAGTRMVLVNDASLAGQPAAAVLRRLRAAGLRPSVLRVPNGHVEPGTVISVQPTGQVAAGGTVTVITAMAPPGHGHAHDHGDGGGGGDNGGGNGGGNGGNGGGD